jgi:hypothetical protein
MIIRLEVVTAEGFVGLARLLGRIVGLRGAALTVLAGGTPLER